MCVESDIYWRRFYERREQRIVDYLEFNMLKEHGIYTKRPYLNHKLDDYYE